MEKFGVVRVMRQVGRAKLCRLNEENEVMRRLILLDSALGRRTMEQATKEEQAKAVTA